MSFPDRLSTQLIQGCQKQIRKHVLPAQASGRNCMSTVWLVAWATTQANIYRVSRKSLRGFARLYLGNPSDYRNGIGAKRCVSSLSFVWFFFKCWISYGFSKLWPIYEKKVFLTNFFFSFLCLLFKFFEPANKRRQWKTCQ
jgi:hypothetical protein